MSDPAAGRNRTAARDRNGVVAPPVRSETTPLLWLGRYQALLIATDLFAAVCAVVLAYLLRFGETNSARSPAAVVFCVVMPLAWVTGIAANRAYERRFVGVGSEEFERVFRAFLHLVAGMTFAFYVADVSLARGFAFPALALALIFDLIGRHAAREVLYRRRSAGASMSAVIAVGSGASVARFAALLQRDCRAGLELVGACVPGDPAEAERDLGTVGVPVVGGVDSVRAAACRHGAHTVVVLAGAISADKLRSISWQLEGTEVALLLSPGLAETCGRRLHVQPVAGLPLLHIEQPAFSGFRRVIKRAFDIVVSATALTILAPALLAIGLLTRLTSRGPALFRQTRVGLHGREFRVMKFRSMCADADQQKVTLIESNEAGGLLFKIRADPRVTRTGRFLRRFSLDELPQLFNVLAGSMSLVGPRPPLPEEVARYGDDVRRRLLVKPGITGLWQVSGRSDLSWEESVRLDLRYVEDWSLSLDLAVLCRTVGAVLVGRGAY